MIGRAVMIETMLAGLRVDAHAADGIEDFSIVRIDDTMLIVMRCVSVVVRVRTMAVGFRGVSAAAIRSIGCAGGRCSLRPDRAAAAFFRRRLLGCAHPESPPSALAAYTL
jgi:hypothetical protein